MKNNMYRILLVVLCVGFGLKGQNDNKSSYLGNLYNYCKGTDLITGRQPEYIIKAGEKVPKHIAAQHENKVGAFKNGTLIAKDDIKVEEKNVLLNDDRKVALGAVAVGALYWQRENVGKALTWLKNGANSAAESISYWIGKSIVKPLIGGYKSEEPVKKS